MTVKPIESANDSDLRLSFKALQRAALRARERAAQTGTAIVVSRNGVIEQIYPQADHVAAVIQEPSSPPYSSPASKDAQ